ncbi:roquin-2 isoform X2 [Lepisosteus oculatus]|uniref:roquin-2 isoform X2 n=1 Tax=Lepisosteus oculatus TaxID=7918 RepID=UPI00371CE8EE
MPVQAAQWTEFLSCPICYNEFDESVHRPISLGCSHTVCKTCLNKLHRKACPFDQTAINTDIDVLPVNFALLQLVGAQVPDHQTVSLSNVAESKHYEVAKKCVEELALYLKPISGGKGVASLSQSALSRPMQRKLVTLVNCQLVEEEGRVRAMRAARSLGERTVTELILQHQNPQQLSANLWAAVRARGCQFLGPAMQEDALKLVLLALEDGSALSRKVLVLFVVQKLEARFPQASKTSIGHVVQLLYRASCFKVTKRDEDSSLMQLKEEFRTYEALRREHDAQIVHIAMEAGLRISPEQWSSLLYGDLAHKSHMQSIIDKLQSPESFAKSVQELTIVLQRTGDPANLNCLRPHLELLANIDHNPDAAPPTWDQLENVMLAVKIVVHGLVDFIQNFSKKGHETPQPQPNSKYKTSMCRDLRQQGGCPRGSNCTFAHSQEELEKYRMRNKKISGTVRPYPLPQTVLGKTAGSTAGSGLAEGMEKGAPSSAVLSLADSTAPKLIPRGGDACLEDLKKLARSGSSSLGALSTSPTEPKTGSPPKTPVNHVSATSAIPPSAGADSSSVHSKPGQFVPRVSLYPSQQADVYYQDHRTPYDVASYQQSNNYYTPPPASLQPGQCGTRYVRSSNVPEGSLPPPSVPYPDQYSSFPGRERVGSSAYPPPPPPPLPPPPPQQYGPVPPVHSGMYAPVYDSRRMWRPQMYHRDDVRSNSLPPMDVMHSSVYQPPLRERYNSLDGYYSVPSEQRAAPLQRDSYSRMQVGYEELFRRKPEQWAHYHSQKPPPLVSPALPPATQSPSPSSPLFTVDFSTEFSDNSGDYVSSKYKGEDPPSHYSPWSCGTISTCINVIDSEPKDVMANSSVELMDHDSLSIKRRMHLFEPHRRLKDEDPIIPFGEGPIISKWGAISRSSRTGYHTTDPIQATASQGSTTKPINFRDYGPYINHSDSRWSSCGSDSSNHSSFLESDQLGVSDLKAQRKSSTTGDTLSTDLQQADFAEDLVDDEPERDIELELSALDADEADVQDDKLELRINSHNNHVSNGSAAGNGHQIKQQDKIVMGSHLLKKIAFKKSITPAGGLGSPGLSINELDVKTDPLRAGEGRKRELTHPASNGEMLLNGS